MTLRRPGIGDWILASLVGAMIVMMIVPLQPWIMDLMIALNLAGSISVFCLALFIRRPLDFSVFPTVLLVATLFRLSLNISSTRLILTKADAGRIISGFGGFVVGDDILVGAIVFTVIALVLFLVITRGAERVAEVSARFSLDALPGMQLAIEADARSGGISSREIARRRAALSSTSHYYGALDGAMKFVRGDAVAAIVIAVVNIVGGIAIGTLRGGMSILDALNLYGRLTIGDGLVCMIPALLISTAAGILVTRISHAEDDVRLGAQLGAQISSDPLALVAAAIMVGTIGFVPGLPLWPFLLMASLLALIVLGVLRKGAAISHKQTGATGTADESLSLDRVQQMLDRLSDSSPVLVRESVPSRLSLVDLLDILEKLADEDIGPHYLPDVLLAAVRAPVSSDPEERLSRIREQMASVITRSVVPGGQAIRAAVIDEEVMSVLEGALSRGVSGRRLILPVDLSAELLSMFQKTLAPMSPPILLTSSGMRRPLFSFLKDSLPGIRVLSPGEIHTGATVDVAARVCR